MPRALEQMDRHHSALLAHLSGDDLPHLVDFYARLSNPDHLPGITQTLTDFQQFDDNTSAADLELIGERLDGDATG